jgi:hypothetical protein
MVIGAFLMTEKKLGRILALKRKEKMVLLLPLEKMVTGFWAQMTPVFRLLAIMD